MIYRSLGGLIAADIISAYGPGVLTGFVYIGGIVTTGPDITAVSHSGVVTSKN